MQLEDLILDLEQTVEIEAPPTRVFAALLRRFGSDTTQPDGTPMPMILEPRAGGRWYRDRGDGIQHLWGFVQVIKPPSLLELSGPMFMSYPANNHIEIKVEEESPGARVTLRHRALGMISPHHREGLGKGWQHHLSELKKACR